MLIRPGRSTKENEIHSRESIAKDEIDEINTKFYKEMKCVQLGKLQF